MSDKKPDNRQPRSGTRLRVILHNPRNHLDPVTFFPDRYREIVAGVAGFLGGWLP